MLVLLLLLLTGPFSPLGGPRVRTVPVDSLAGDGIPVDRFAAAGQPYRLQARGGGDDARNRGRRTQAEALRGSSSPSLLMGL